MRGLTLTQPYASLVAEGLKTVETRSWQTKYRGPVLIHAARKLEPVGGVEGMRRLLARGCFRDALTLKFGHRPVPADFPRGAVLAVAYLEEVMPVECAIAHGLVPPGCERLFGDYSRGRYAWLLRLVARLREPVEGSGRLSLWKPSEELLRALGGQTIDVPGLRL